MTISVLLDGENISFGASLIMYINSTNIPPIIIMNRIYENQNLLYIFPLIRQTIIEASINLVKFMIYPSPPSVSCVILESI